MSYQCDWCHEKIKEPDEFAYAAQIESANVSDDGTPISVAFDDNGSLEIKAVFRQEAAVHYHERCLMKLAIHELQEALEFEEP